MQDIEPSTDRKGSFNRSRSRSIDLRCEETIRPPTRMFERTSGRKSQPYRDLIRPFRIYLLLFEETLLSLIQFPQGIELAEARMHLRLLARSQVKNVQKGLLLIFTKSGMREHLFEH